MPRSVDDYYGGGRRPSCGTSPGGDMGQDGVDAINNALADALEALGDKKSQVLVDMTEAKNNAQIAVQDSATQATAAIQTSKTQATTAIANSVVEVQATIDKVSELDPATLKGATPYAPAAVWEPNQRYRVTPGQTVDLPVGTNGDWIGILVESGCETTPSTLRVAGADWLVLDQALLFTITHDGVMWSW